MTTLIRIAIAESSPIIRSGLEAQLKKLAKYKVQISYLTEDARRDWQENASLSTADVFILNPLICGLHPHQTFDQHENTKFVALSYGTTDPNLLKGYDDTLHITDSVQQIADLFDRLIQTSDDGNTPGADSQTLTPREREIVICIVKGMTNKEIASQLFLSTHTVITHRRNISKKLQIHSASGLTIYAIMNKMVELGEISQKE